MKNLHLLLFFSIATLISAQIPTQGLIARYDFNGNAKDSTSNMYDGTINGAVLIADRFGNSNAAYDFNGSSAYISLPANGLKPKYYTYSIWAKADTIPPNGGYTFPFAIGYNGGTGITLVNNAQQGWGTSSYNIGNPVISYVDEGRQQKINDWCHIAVTRDDSLLRIYVDGKLNTHAITINGYNHETKGTNPNYGTVSGAWIGTRNLRAGEYFDGQVDDVRIYNRALSDCEIMELYLEKNPCRTVINDTNKINVAVHDTLIIDANLSNISNPSNWVKVLVYPNPAKDTVSIFIKDYSKMNGYSFVITDALSKEVWRSNITKSSYSISLNTFGSRGIYFLTLLDPSMKMIEVKKIQLQ